ncbi:MAG: hypothetical protein GYB68_15840 [Chloroflexi bacterium]|nr:hypothetical protein [Chloroflexota bacterium]
MSEARLRAAVELIKLGQRKEARNIVMSVLREDRHNADAWLLASELADSREARVQTLRRALQLRPDDVRILQKLEDLEGYSDILVEVGGSDDADQSLEASQSRSPQQNPSGSGAVLRAVVEAQNTQLQLLQALSWQIEQQNALIDHMLYLFAKERQGNRRVRTWIEVSLLAIVALVVLGLLVSLVFFLVPGLSFAGLFGGG